MNKIFNKKIYLLLLGSVVSLWLINFLTGQQDAQEIKTPQSELIATRNNVEQLPFFESQDSIELKLSLTLSQLEAVAAGMEQSVLPMVNRVNDAQSETHTEQVVLSRSFLLSQAHAVEVDATQSSATIEKKARTQQALERGQEMGLNLEKLSRQKIELPDGDPFVAKLPPPPPPLPPSPPPPPPEPVAPAFPFTFMGRMVENDTTTIFLTRQNQSYSVKLNGIVEREYRVDRIDNDQVIFTYLPLNIPQTLYIGRSG